MSSQSVTRRPKTATALIVTMIIESVIWLLFFVIAVLDLSNNASWASLMLIIFGFHGFALFCIFRKHNYVAQVLWTLTTLYWLGVIACIFIFLIASSYDTSGNDAYAELGKGLTMIFSIVVAVLVSIPATLKTTLLRTKSAKQWLRSDV